MRLFICTKTIFVFVFPTKQTVHIFTPVKLNTLEKKYEKKRKRNILSKEICKNKNPDSASNVHGYN